MRKAPLISFCTVAAMLLMCGVQSDNPLDPANPNFVPPKIIIDSAQTTIKNGDTIHVDSICVAYKGNNARSQFRAWMDNATSQEWASAGEYAKKGIPDGRHVFYIQTQYEGGDRIAEDSIVFYVLVTGYKPHFGYKADTNVIFMVNAACTLSVNPGAVVPVTYHWYKDTVTLAGKQKSELSFAGIQMVDSGKYRCIVSNEYGKDTSRLYIVHVKSAGDTTKPSIRLADSSIEGSRISTNTKKITGVIADAAGIARVRFSIGTDTFAVNKFNDSTYFATVTGLQSGVVSTVIIAAWDSAGNNSALSVHLTCDATIGDNQPPIFSWVSGPKNNQRITADTGTIRYKITDTSGIDSVYYSLNGILKGKLNALPDSQYELHYKLNQYKENTIVIYATDGSAQRNKASEQIVLNYNTMPSLVNLTSPMDGDTAVEYQNGVLLKWTKSFDPDGDSIKYQVFYSDTTNVFTSFITKEDTMRFSNMKSGQKYFFYIIVIAALDSLRCPASEGKFYTFNTRNSPATISTQPISKTQYIGKPVTFAINASSTTPLHYQWKKGGTQNVGTDTNTLTIPAISLKDTNSTYQCVVSNGGGSVTSEPCTLKVIWVSKISCGGNHSLFLRTDGTVLACGQGGLFGDGTKDDRNTPVPVMASAGVPLTNVKDIAAGGTFSIFLLNDGTVYGSGLNSSGALGTGNNDDQLFPVKMSGVSNVKSIAAGGSHSLILTNEGALYACGSNSTAELGNGDVSRSARLSPQEILPKNTTIAIAASTTNSIILRTNRYFQAFGGNWSGQLGIGNLSDQFSPMDVMPIPNISGTASMVAAGEFSLFLNSAGGELYGCGDNYLGELGFTTPADTATPALIMAGVQEIAAGAAHSLIRKTDGTVWACGGNGAGQLGDNTTTARKTPWQLTTEARHIAAGMFCSFLVKNDGTIWACGDNQYGQLGDATNENRYTLKQITF